MITETNYITRNHSSTVALISQGARRSMTGGTKDLTYFHVWRRSRARVKKYNVHQLTSSIIHQMMFESNLRFMFKCFFSVSGTATKNNDLWFLLGKSQASHSYYEAIKFSFKICTFDIQLEEIFEKCLNRGELRYSALIQALHMPKNNNNIEIFGLQQNETTIL